MSRRLSLLLGSSLLLVMVICLLAPSATALSRRCDVAPPGGDGRVDVGDALVVLRASVGLVELSADLLAAADVAPLELIEGVFVRPLGDGEIQAVDALVCLRLAFALIRIPANLRLEIEGVEPQRPAVDRPASIRIRVENDGDLDSAPGARAVLWRVPETAGTEPSAIGDVEFGFALSPGQVVKLEIPFSGEPPVGPATLRVAIEPNGVDLDHDDNEDEITVVVNGPPVADAGPDQAVVEGTLVTLAGSGSDPNGDAFTFSWTQQAGVPVVLAGSSSAPTFTAPDVAVATDLVFALIVRDIDGLESPAATVTVQVVPINDPPVVSELRASAANPPEGSTVFLAGVVDDPNQDPVSITWSQEAGPPVPLNDADQLIASFVVPPLTEPTLFRFRLTAIDSEGSSGSDFLELIGQPVNGPPMAAARAPAFALEGTTVVLDGSASSDPDGDPLAFVWRQLEGPPVALTGGEDALANFVAPETAEATTLRFELRVTDPSAAEDAATVDVRIEPDPVRPAAVRLTVTPSALAPGLDPVAVVQVEVVARGPAAEVPDGTPLLLSTDHGALSDSEGTTRLGRFRTFLTPGLVSGTATLRVEVPGTSAAAQTTVSVRAAPDAVGQVRLSVDPAAVAAGVAGTVRLVALLTPADERNGEVPDGTPVVFEASSGSFPEGSEASAVDGVATVPFTTPAEAGTVAISARAGDANASAVLSVLADPSVAARASLLAGASVAVAGGAEVPIIARLEPLVPDARLAPIAVSLTVEGGLLDGQAVVDRLAVAVPADQNIAPFADFPGPGDLDRDGDGVFDAEGALEVVLGFTASTPGVARVFFADQTLEIPVVAAATDPGRLSLRSDAVALRPGGGPIAIDVSLDSATGGPVADGSVVEAAGADGVVDPGSAITTAGSAAFSWQPPGAVVSAVPTLLRVRAGALLEDLGLALAPVPEAPVAIDLSVDPPVVALLRPMAAHLVAAVRSADGEPAPDGTRVLFSASAGLPGAALATTVDGRAEVALAGPLASGPIHVTARIAGTPFESEAAATAAASERAALILAINAVGPVGSLTVDIALPEGISPIPAAEGVEVQILRPPQGGVGDGFAFASSSGDRVRIASISALGFQGPGLVLRMPIVLEPTGATNCAAFADAIVALATDPLAQPIPDAVVSCAEIAPDVVAP